VLIDGKKKKVSRQSMMELLEHGLRYVFPAASGSLIRGIPTAHAHPFMSHLFPSEEPYVWPDPAGEARGIAIAPYIQASSKQSGLIKIFISCLRLLLLFA
jgi:hypothetical protein